MPLPCTQSFMIPPTRSVPPPRTLAVGPIFVSRPTASWTLVASCSSKAFIASSSRLCALQRGLNLLASERRLGDPDANRVVDGVGDDRRRQRHGRLADAVRAEHPVLLGLLDQDHVGQRRVL